MYWGGLTGLECHNLTVITTKIYALFVGVEEPCRRTGGERSTRPIRSKRSFSCKRGNLPNTWLTPWEAESHSLSVQHRMGRNRMLLLCHCKVLDKKTKRQPVLNKTQKEKSRKVFTCNKVETHVYCFSWHLYLCKCFFYQYMHMPLSVSVCQCVCWIVAVWCRPIKRGRLMTGGSEQEKQ